MAFFYSVIEGFFGRQWSWQVRYDYADFLARYGFSGYIYAPKGDTYLRNDADKPWPRSTMIQLSRLREHYHHMGLHFGVGLSPIRLLHDSSISAKRRVWQKIEQINALNVDILCILFDDIQGDNPHLAAQQLAIVEAIMAVSQAAQHIVCPTYYSWDGILDHVFGKRPIRYLETLGKELPADCGIFWTGNQVISTRVTEFDIERVMDIFDRQVILWDNYLANDGEKAANYLRLKPYVEHSYQLQHLLQGHCVNPMNQALSSQLPLMTLVELYRTNGDYQADQAWLKAIHTLTGLEFRTALVHDGPIFSKVGLSGIDEADRIAWLEKYQRFSHPVATEVSDWLAGRYCFDPACLTS